MLGAGVLGPNNVVRIEVDFGDRWRLDRYRLRRRAAFTWNVTSRYGAFLYTEYRLPGLAIEDIHVTSLTS